MIGMEAIAHVRGGRSAPDDDGWGNSLARIDLDPERFSAAALAGLDAFSHAEIIYLFDKVAEQAPVAESRHPRGRRDWPKVGIFAQRGKERPNRIGVTICRVVLVEGLSLHVEGLDAIDGTPVLDIKPVLKGFLPRGDIREPAWAAEIMAHYW